MDMRRQLIGASAAIREIQEEILCASRTDAKVLITGESGVGKEVVASLIQYESAHRFTPFVAINCAGVPDTLLESELFGHVRGSFTDAYRDKRGLLDQAQGGTIFLDEIGEMSSRMQAVLLRFLETGEIQRVGAERAHAVARVRIVAATNRDLLARVAEKKFRDDLYYRLNVIRIVIPPLRERMEDVPLLVEYFVRTASETHNVPQPRLHDDTIARLMTHSWPGNVRELKNVIERLVVRARGGFVSPNDLSLDTPGLWPLETVHRHAAAPAQADRLYERMTVGGESFWSVVSEPFMARDITRDDLRAVISKGLEETRGSYKQLLPLFNIAAEDYKRLLSFLRKYGCHLPFQRFRTVAVRSDSLTFHRERMDSELEREALKSSA
jgi:DNA-binding NtrC family response regulator